MVCWQRKSNLQMVVLCLWNPPVFILLLSVKHHQPSVYMTIIKIITVIIILNLRHRRAYFVHAASCNASKVLTSQDVLNDNEMILDIIYNVLQNIIIPHFVRFCINIRFNDSVSTYITVHDCTMMFE